MVFDGIFVAVKLVKTVSEVSIKLKKIKDFLYIAEHNTECQSTRGWSNPKTFSLVQIVSVDFQGF
jgi:hypothetical protein